MATGGVQSQPVGGPSPLPEVLPAKKGKNTGVDYVHIKIGDKQFAAYEVTAWKKVSLLTRIACWFRGNTTEVQNDAAGGKKYIVINASVSKAYAGQLKSADSTSVLNLLNRFSGGKIHAPTKGPSQKEEDQKAATPDMTSKAKSKEGDAAANAVDHDSDLPAAGPKTLKDEKLSEIFPKGIKITDLTDHETFKAIRGRGAKSPVSIGDKQEFFVVAYHFMEKAKGDGGVQKNEWVKIAQNLPSAEKKQIAEAANNQEFQRFLIEDCKMPKDMVKQFARELSNHSGS